MAALRSHATTATASVPRASCATKDQFIVVQETEYTGAGKHHYAQLAFAKENGIRIETGDPASEKAGETIIFPSHPDRICAREVDLDPLRASLIRNALKNRGLRPSDLSKTDLQFLADEVSRGTDFVSGVLNSL